MKKKKIKNIIYTDPKDSSVNEKKITHDYLGFNVINYKILSIYILYNVNVR